MSTQSFLAFNYHGYFVLILRLQPLRDKLVRMMELKGTDRVENHNIIKALPVEKASAPICVMIT